MKREVVIIGGGPAGLAAAIEAKRDGCDVLLVDENRRAGGQLFKQLHKFFGSRAHRAGVRGIDIGKQLLMETEELGIDFWLNSACIGIFPDKRAAILRDGKKLWRHRSFFCVPEARKIHSDFLAGRSQV